VNLLETPFQVRIGDLGFSKILDNIDNLSMTYCGTPINMAPEMLNKNKYNYKADVWSVGTILFELLTGYSPFREAKNKDQLKAIVKTNIISVPRDVIISKECLRFINVCLTYNP
jgi:serine/threonine-protein kinase ULK/ATG1